MKTSREVGTRLRDRETLLKRLIPLRGQYAEDLSKLVFFAESKTLFDPLRIVTCPSCLSALSAPPSIQDGHCTLCGTALASEESGPSLDITKETTATRTKLRELNSFIEQVEKEIRELTSERRAASEAERAAQEELDRVLATAVSPFLSQRDSTVRRLEGLRADEQETSRGLAQYAAIETRRQRLASLDDQVVTLRRKLRDLAQNRPDKSQVVADLSLRFADILAEFKFPKLSEAWLDQHFVPHVRGNVYKRIGSTGALTLISVAWALALFESAVERELPHPGFLMIDSPQKNLTATAAEVDPEFTSPHIALAVYDHLLRWTAESGSDAQVILVDNAPPPHAGANVVVRYSGDPRRPPYGLIEDEVS